MNDDLNLTFTSTLWTGSTDLSNQNMLSRNVLKLYAVSAPSQDQFRKCTEKNHCELSFVLTLMSKQAVKNVAVRPSQRLIYTIFVNSTPKIIVNDYKLLFSEQFIICLHFS